MKKLLFVYNPHSGKGETGKALSEIVGVFREAGFLPTVYPTSAARDGQDFIKNNAGDYDLIVSGGGDGMLHELFCGLISSGLDIPCGYIPAGTVNDFASSLKIPKDPVKAAEIAVSGNYRRVDAGTFNDSIFSYVAAFGLFTDVSYATDQSLKNALGAGAYFIEVLKSMDMKHFAQATVHTRISANGEEYEEDLIFGMGANTYSVGGFGNLVPQGAEMDDGLIDGVFIRAPKNLSDLDRITKALMSHSLDIPDIICVKSDRIEIVTDRAVDWTLDGEFGGTTGRAVIGAKKAAVNIAAP